MTRLGGRLPQGEDSTEVVSRFPGRGGCVLCACPALLPREGCLRAPGASLLGGGWLQVLPCPGSASLESCKEPRGRAALPWHRGRPCSAASGFREGAWGVAQRAQALTSPQQAGCCRVVETALCLGALGVEV